MFGGLLMLVSSSLGNGAFSLLWLSMPSIPVIPFRLRSIATIPAIILMVLSKIIRENRLTDSTCQQW